MQFLRGINSWKRTRVEHARESELYVSYTESNESQFFFPRVIIFNADNDKRMAEKGSIESLENLFGNNLRFVIYN